MRPVALPGPVYEPSQVEAALRRGRRDVAPFEVNTWTMGAAVASTPELSVGDAGDTLVILDHAAPGMRHTGFVADLFIPRNAAYGIPVVANRVYRIPYASYRLKATTLNPEAVGRTLRVISGLGIDYDPQALPIIGAQERSNAADGAWDTGAGDGIIRPVTVDQAGRLVIRSADMGTMFSAQKVFAVAGTELLSVTLGGDGVADYLYLNVTAGATLYLQDTADGAGIGIAIALNDVERITGPVLLSTCQIRASGATTVNVAACVRSTRHKTQDA